MSLDEKTRGLDLALEAKEDSLFGSELLKTVTGKANALEALFQALTHDFKFSEFVHEVLLAMMLPVKCESGSILEVDYNNNTVFFRAATGTRSENLTDFVIPVGSGIVGHVIESKQPLAIQDPDSSVHLRTISQSIGFEVRNLVAIPILIRGRVFGVLELLNKIGDPEFTASDLELLTYLTQIAAKAIEIRLMIAWSSQKLAGPEEEKIA